MKTFECILHTRTNITFNCLPCFHAGRITHTHTFRLIFIETTPTDNNGNRKKHHNIATAAGGRWRWCRVFMVKTIRLIVHSCIQAEDIHLHFSRGMPSEIFEWNSLVFPFGLEFTVSTEASRDQFNFTRTRNRPKVACQASVTHSICT